MGVTFGSFLRDHAIIIRERPLILSSFSFCIFAAVDMREINDSYAREFVERHVGLRGIPRRRRLPRIVAAVGEPARAFTSSAPFQTMESDRSIFPRRGEKKKIRRAYIPPRASARISRGLSAARGKSKRIPPARPALFTDTVSIIIPRRKMGKAGSSS